MITGNPGSLPQHGAADPTQAAGAAGHSGVPSPGSATVPGDGQLYWLTQRQPPAAATNPAANVEQAAPPANPASAVPYATLPGPVGKSASDVPSGVRHYAPLSGHLPASSPPVPDGLLQEMMADVPRQLGQVLHTLQHPEQFDPAERLRNCRAFYYLEKFVGPAAAPAMPPPQVVEQAAAPHLYFVGGEQLGSDSAESTSTHSSWDIHLVRRDFPILHQKVNGKPLVWLDSAATSQKPIQVIEAVEHFYKCDNSNVHRGAHTLAARATDAFEGAREKVQRFLGAASAREIIFVRNATEAVNLVAQSFGRANVRAGDEIVLTRLEHHANIVPWQMLAQETGAVLRVVPLNARGEVILEEYERLLNQRTKLVAIAHVSNALGTVLPVQQMIAMARRYPVRVLVDGAQSVPHFRVNVQALDADFYVFSGHKLFAPTGIGALYGKLALLESMPPWQGGGSMIADVSFEGTTFNTVPHKFEAGTAHIAGAVGLGAAIDYLDRIGFEAAAAYEDALTAYATQALATVPGLRPIGTAAHKVGVLSFIIDGLAIEEVGRALAREGIAVRAGHHCAQPAVRHFGLEGTVRPSLAFYNTPQEIDFLVATLHRIARSRRR